MNILITGAAGIIGTSLTKKIISETDHNIFTYDTSLPEDYKLREYPFPIDKIFNHERVSNTYDPKIPNLIEKLYCWPKIQLVIHLAEMAINDYGMINDEAIETNVLMTKTLLIKCSRQNIRCIVPVWQDVNYNLRWDEHCSLLPRTLAWRSEITDFYNKGNMVVTKLFVPKIIHKDMPASYFESYISRIANFYNGIAQYFYIFDNEVFHNRILRSWTTLDKVVEKIIEIIPRRTREPLCLDTQDILYTNDETTLRTTLTHFGIELIPMTYILQKHESINNHWYHPGTILTKNSCKLIQILQKTFPLETNE